MGKEIRYISASSIILRYRDRVHVVKKSFLTENREPFMWHGQCHGCWWPGSFRRQGINSYAIDPMMPVYAYFSVITLFYKNYQHWGKTCKRFTPIFVCTCIVHEDDMPLGSVPHYDHSVQRRYWVKFFIQRIRRRSNAKWSYFFAVCQNSVGVWRYLNVLLTYWHHAICFCSVDIGNNSLLEHAISVDLVFFVN